MNLFKKLEEHYQKTVRKQIFKKAKKRTKFAAEVFFTPLLKEKVK